MTSSTDVKASKSILASSLISRLQELVAEHGDVPCVVLDADTEWTLLMDERCAWFGKDSEGYGQDGAIMLKSMGYCA